jgi:hypothetical protein
MASKLVPLADAAVQLGVSPDELNEMRQRGDIYGYRDGASWKFKAEDLDKLQQDRASASSGGLGSGVNFGLGSDLGMKDFDLPASPRRLNRKRSSLAWPPTTRFRCSAMGWGVRTLTREPAPSLAKVHRTSPAAI